LAAALLGHSWAVTFGSLGAAFFVIQGITGVEYADLAWYMFIFGTAAHFLTGIGVCFVYDGFSGIKKGFLYVLPVSLVMTGVQFLMVSISAYPVAGLVPALVGLITLFGLYKIRSRGEKKEEAGLYRGEKLNLLQAALPYLVIIVVALSFQLVPQSVNDAASFGPNVPGFSTPLDEGPLNFADFEATIGYIGASGNRYHYVRAETNYNPLRVFRHPAVLLLSAALTAILVYKSVGIFDGEVFKGAIKKTVKKGIPATLALLALGNMSLIMMDSGMTLQLAQTTADLTGQVYPLFAPFIGVLGSFLTGNNTNANVLFGAFQYNIAGVLDFSQAAMSAVQSMTAGVAVSIGPTLILMGALASGQKGVEPTILKKLLPIVLLIALVIGGINVLIMNFGFLAAPGYYPYVPY
jgi:lactate permease